MLSMVCLLQVGCVCNNAQLRGDQIIGHPTEGAMLAVAHKMNLFGLRDQFVRTEERTFNSEKKWMGVLVRPRTHQITEVSHSPPLLLSPSLSPALSPSLSLTFTLSLSLSHLHSLPLPQFPSKDEEWYMKGALDVVLRHCTTVAGGEPLTPALHEHFTTVASEFGHQGLRGQEIVHN